MSRSGFFKQGPAPTGIAFRAIQHAAFAYVIIGHGGAIRREHAATFQALGFELGANGCWYIPRALVDAAGKLVDARAREYARRNYDAGRGMR